MYVVLINPKFPNGHVDFRPPLGILYIAASLKKSEIEVIIIDENILDNPKLTIQQALKKKPICVGISSILGSSCQEALKTSKLIKELSPDTKIVLGGVWASLQTDIILDSGFVDCICLGDGEETFREIVEVYHFKRDLNQVQGVVFKNHKNEIVTTKQRSEYFDLDNLPQLPYSLVDLSKYQSRRSSSFFQFPYTRLLSLETSRGCGFRCSFCSNAATRRPYRAMSPETTLRHLVDAQRAGADGVAVVDDNFFQDHERASMILKKIKEEKLGLNLSFLIRADYLVMQGLPFVELLEEAGCKMVLIGAESGSTRILKNIIGKKSSTQNIHNANKLLKHSKIKGVFGFLIGLPQEKIFDISSTFKSCFQILRQNHNSRVTLNKLIPLPKSPILQDCFSNGLVEPKTLEEWIKLEDPRWERNTVYIPQKISTWFENHRKYFDFLRSYRFENWHDSKKDCRYKLKAWFKYNRLNLFFTLNHYLLKFTHR